MKKHIKANKTQDWLVCTRSLQRFIKYFEVALKLFEFSRVWENAESWLVYANKIFWIAQPYFSTEIIKQS